jgi:hypothetical protein
MKRCTKCGKLKDETDFNKHARGKNGLCAMCRTCFSEYNKIRYTKKRDVLREISRNYHYARGVIPMEKKKDSSQYLGIYINERILKHVMPNAVLMDNNNPGYDLVCGKGYLVDAKAAVASHYKENTCKWMFGIRQNKIPDYFLLTAYKDRTTLEIVHMWLIPGIQLNDKQTISISSSTIEKWNDWKIDHTDALNCISKIGEIQ